MDWIQPPARAGDQAAYGLTFILREKACHDYHVSRTSPVCSGHVDRWCRSLASACGGDDDKEKKETITISGAFALYPMVVQWADEYQKTHKDVQFDISAGGAGKGMSDVLAGAVDVAMVSREVRAEETDQGAAGVRRRSKMRS